MGLQLLPFRCSLSFCASLFLLTLSLSSRLLTFWVWVWVPFPLLLARLSEMSALWLPRASYVPSCVYSSHLPVTFSHRTSPPPLTGAPLGQDKEGLGSERGRPIGHFIDLIFLSSQA